jgi:hypothetical protein
MVVNVINEGRFGVRLGIIGVAYLTNLCCLAIGADWARVVAGGFSAIVVIACLFVIATESNASSTVVAAVVFGLPFAYSTYALFLSKALRAEIEDRRRLYKREAKGIR